MSLPRPALHRLRSIAPRLGALCLCVLAGACGSKRGPQVLLRVAGVSAGGTERCGAMTAVGGDTLTAANLRGTVTKLRATFVARDAGGQAVAFCDRLFNPGGEPPFVRAPRGGTSIDVHLEAYGEGVGGDPTPVRLATGSLLGVDPEQTKLGPIRLYPTEVFRCAGGRLAHARAFHSATALPDGRVLFVGGLVASTSDPGATALPASGVTATGQAEIFNPLDQTLTPVSEDAEPTGRAFHHAFLASGSSACPAGQLAVLLVGGLSPTQPGKPMLGTSRGMQGGRLVPFDMATIPNPLGAAAAKTEYLCLDPAANHATRVDATDSNRAAFQGADRRDARVVAAGGLDYDAMTLNTPVPRTTAVAIDLTGGGTTVGMIGSARTGASLTILDGQRALLWGGGTSADPVGELLSGVDATPSSTPLMVAGSAITQFHTATLVGGGATPSVLVTGGFEVTSGGVNTQPPNANQAVRLITVSAGSAASTQVGFGGGYVADLTCGSDGTRYKPAGWESAVSLPNGGVLVTGGTPSTMTVASAMRCADCVGDASLVCAIPQASIYDTRAVPATLDRAVEPLQVARFGHTSTVLHDGTVLIAGGIGGEPGGSGTAAVFLADLEVYNPRKLVAPFDAASGIDADDPIADVVAGGAADKVKLHRAPGAEAVDPAQPDAPARECGSL